MQHWIEPEVLGEAQRTGMNSPALSPDVQHYVNRPGQLSGMGQLPGMAPPGVQHYVNRPGQLSGIGNTVTRLLPGILVGAALVGIVLPWFGVALAMKPRKRG